VSAEDVAPGEGASVVDGVVDEGVEDDRGEVFVAVEESARVVSALRVEERKLRDSTAALRTLSRE